MICPYCGKEILERTTMLDNTSQHICEHDWYQEPQAVTTSSINERKWRCRKCLETKVTYD